MILSCDNGHWPELDVMSSGIFLSLRTKREITWEGVRTGTVPNLKQAGT